VLPTVFLPRIDRERPRPDTTTTEPFESVNPNGRVPAITDPNNSDISLWESGAIIEYLLATYDSSNSLSYTSSPNKFLTQSWLHFQTSGQGPYFGQRAEEKPQSVLDRYGAEIWRVTGVIEAQLKKNGDWLVGDKCSYADLAFVPWYWLCPAIMGEGFDKVSSLSCCGRMLENVVC
jgi:glutathione S-transferase